MTTRFVLLLLISCFTFTANAALHAPAAPQLYSVLETKAEARQSVFFPTNPSAPPDSAQRKYLPGFTRTMVGCGLVGVGILCYMVSTIQSNANPDKEFNLDGLGAFIFGVLFFFTGVALALSGLGTRYKYKSRRPSDF